MNLLHCLFCSMRLIFCCMLLSLISSEGKATDRNAQFDNFEDFQTEADSQLSIQKLLDIAYAKKHTDQDLAISFANQAKKRAEASKNVPLEISSLLIFSEIYVTSSAFDQAFNYANEAKRIAVSENLIPEKANSYLALTLVHDQLGRYNHALKTGFEALELFDQIKDEKGKSKANSYIGGCWFSLGNYDKAFHYYSKALEIARMNKDSVN